MTRRRHYCSPRRTAIAAIGAALLAAAVASSAPAPASGADRTRAAASAADRTPAPAASGTEPTRTAAVSAPHPQHAATTRTQPATPNRTGTTRLCAPAKPGYATCFALRRTDIAAARKATGGTEPDGYAPADLRSAYGLPTTGAGGATIGIVDAYDDPSAEADLAVYRAQYGLPACGSATGCFGKIDQRGGTDYPDADSGWAGEISLDLDMASAICPSCRILLVEADSNQLADLGAAVDQAVSHGAKYVSNSYGAPEDSSITTLDADFYRHPGVVMTAAAGDTGYGVAYPASSPFVTSVGGTDLVRDATSPRGWTESVWNDGDGATGSGCSAIEAKPAFQHDTGCGRRTVADVSAVADPANGVAVYDTTGGFGWGVLGGTSAAAPIIAGMYALAGSPASGDFPAGYPYTDPNGLNDVTTGSNGSCGGTYLCTAGPGYDAPTGLGTPHGVGAFRVPGPHGTLSGTITDAASTKPVSGALVRVGDAQVSTDAEGRYRLIAPAGRQTVTASKFGYADATAAATITPTATATLNLSLRASPSVTLSGAVTDASGHGWPLYATVQVAGDPAAPVHTDPATGAFSVRVPADATYTLLSTAGSDGYLPQQTQVTVGDTAVRRTIGLHVAADSCTAPGYTPTSTGLREDFDGSAVPAGWTVQSVAGTSGAWEFDDPGHRGNTTGGDGGFAVVDSDHAGQGNSQDTSLISPTVDLSGSRQPSVSFDTDYFGSTNSTADVDLSTDSGATWANIWHQGVGGVRGQVVQIPVPQAAGKPGVRVRFHYGANWAWFWEVDDVVVGDRGCQAQPGGLAVGRITDANTGAALDGARVSGPGGISTTSRPTPGDATIGGGLYTLFSPTTGPVHLVAHAGKYSDASAAVTVRADAAVRADLALTAGRIAVTGTLSASVALGSSTTRTLTLTNSGTASETVRLVESSAPHPPPPAAAAARRVPRREIPGRYSPLPASSGVPGAPAPAPAPKSESSAPPDLPGPLGDASAATAPDGTVYVVGGRNATSAVATVWAYSPGSKKWTARAPLPAAREKPAVAFLGGKLVVVGGWDSTVTPSSDTYLYDPTRNSWTTGPAAPVAVAAAGSGVVDDQLIVVGGCDDKVSCGASTVARFDLATNSWAQLADYPHRVSWESCGGISGRLICAGGIGAQTSYADGYSYDPGTDTWSGIAAPPADVWGAYYAVSANQLLVSGGITRDSTLLTNTGARYDATANSWSALPNAPVTAYRGAGACGFYGAGGYPDDTLAQPPLRTVFSFPGYGSCAGTQDLPWLSENPGSVRIAPGRSAVVTVRFDATSLSGPGVLTGALALFGSGPYHLAPIPVRLSVTVPASWGRVTGTVTGTSCSVSHPLAAATVTVAGGSGHRSGVTDSAGRYTVWADSRGNPSTVTASAPGWRLRTVAAQVEAGGVATVDVATTPVGSVRCPGIRR